MAYISCDDACDSCRACLPHSPFVRRLEKAKNCFQAQLTAAIEFSVSHDVHSFHRFTPNETNLLSTTDQTNIGLVFRHFSQLRHVLKHASTGHGQAHAVMERSSQIC